MTKRMRSRRTLSACLFNVVIGDVSAQPDRIKAVKTDFDSVNLGSNPGLPAKASVSIAEAKVALQHRSRYESTPVSYPVLRH